MPRHEDLTECSPEEVKHKLGLPPFAIALISDIYWKDLRPEFQKTGFVLKTKGLIIEVYPSDQKTIVDMGKPGVKGK